MNTPGYQEAVLRIANMQNSTLVLNALQLSVLPPLPEGVKILLCEQNQLTTLPKLPNSLEYLYCKQNQITSLPKLPNSLKELVCKQNQLTRLPELPDSLIHLLCEENQLTELPELPDFLQSIFCVSNQLITLPKLPNSLKYLYCGQNQLTRLPKLPNSLVYLQCAQNQITRLPEIPDSLHGLDCDNNPLVEPFATYYATLQQTGDLDQLSTSIRTYYAPIREKARSVHGLIQTLGRQGRLPDALEGEIAGFLTGVMLPSGRAKPIHQQLANLKANAGVGGSRKKRATRRHSRKGGKTKRRYHK
jgi:hypothetical protein